jgi:hypothetical protein
VTNACLARRGATATAMGSARHLSAALGVWPESAGIERVRADGWRVSSVRPSATGVEPRDPLACRDIWLRSVRAPGMHGKRASPWRALFASETARGGRAHRRRRDRAGPSRPAGSARSPSSGADCTRDPRLARSRSLASVTSDLLRRSGMTGCGAALLSVRGHRDERAAGDASIRLGAGKRGCAAFSAGRGSACG